MVAAARGGPWERDGRTRELTVLQCQAGAAGPAFFAASYGAFVHPPCCRDVRRLDVFRKPDGTPPDLPRRADLLVYEVGRLGCSCLSYMRRSGHMKDWFQPQRFLSGCRCSTLGASARVCCTCWRMRRPSWWRRTPRWCRCLHVYTASPSRCASATCLASTAARPTGGGGVPTMRVWSWGNAGAI